MPNNHSAIVTAWTPARRREALRSLLRDARAHRRVTDACQAATRVWGTEYTVDMLHTEYSVRRRIGLTQGQVARLMRCTQSTYANWERGSYKVALYAVPILADILGLDPHTREEFYRLTGVMWWPSTPAKDTVRQVRAASPLVV